MFCFYCLSILNKRLHKPLVQNKTVACSVDYNALFITNKIKIQFVLYLLVGLKPQNTRFVSFVRKSAELENRAFRLYLPK